MTNRWTGSWLGGPASSGLLADEQEWRGQRLGLPKHGAGSLAGTGRRLGQFVVDALSSALVAGFFVQPPRNWSLLAFVLSTLVFLTLVGQTPGMALFRMRLVPLDGGRVSPWAAFVRTALLVLLVPALVTDKDGRGLHDKAAGTVVLLTHGEDHD